MKNRFLLHTTTDKPIYKLKDTVYIRSVILNALNQAPNLYSKLVYNSKCNIVGPKGDNVASFQLTTGQDSTFACQWTIPEQAAGGNYTVKFVSEVENICPSERTFEIRTFQNPRLNTQLEFIKKGYTAGENVTAKLTVKRAEGGYPNEGSIVKCTSRIDGEETWSGEVKLDKTGNCLIKFDLPKEIIDGEGTLIAVIQDGGVIETSSKTIPILREYIDCKVYPEGGDLVDQLECGIYVEAFTPQGEPADFSADIIDNDQKIVGNISTQHEGRGKSYFVPSSSKNYVLKVTRPTGIKREISLPKVKDQGVSIVSLNDVYESNQVKLKVSATKAKEYVATIFKKDEQLDQLKVNIEKDHSSSFITFNLKKETLTEGVLRVLITDNDQPLAERLIFRKPSDKIDIEIVPNYKSYSPGDNAKITLKAKNQKGEPIVCYTSVSIVDESVLESVEKRKQAPRLPCMVFLEQEVDHLEDAHIYLSDDQKADVAIDLLLGTQGWRRFKCLSSEEFINEKKEKAERVLGQHKGISMESLEIQNNQREMKEVRPMRRMLKKEEGVQLIEKRKKAQPIEEAKKDAPKKEVKKEEKDQKVDVKEKEKVAPKNEVIAPIPPKKEEKVAPKEEERRRVIIPKMDQKKEKEKKKKVPMKFIRDDSDSDEDDVIKTFVRVYAFSKSPNRKLGDRINFKETLYWNAAAKTNEKGEFTFDFALSDSVTSFRVLVDSFSEKALFGSNSRLIESKEPFYIEPKVPLEVTSSDRILLPLGIVNSSLESLDAKVEVNFNSKAIKIQNQKVLNDKISLQSNDRKRIILDLQVGNENKEVSMEIKGNAGVFADNVTRPLKIVPNGFPMNVSSSGLMENQFSIQFSIPKNVEPTSIVPKFEVILTSAGTLTKAFESLIRSPSGCFEQTSSSNYPLTMAHQYFISKRADPELLKKSYNFIDAGYKRLISYECKNNGYEWFGQGDGHEALTSYGLLQFLEMSKFYPVDKNMLDRTIKWLEGRKNKQGGFLRNSRALDSFGGAPENITNAYIVYCLTECGIGNLETEIEYIYKDALENKDTYLTGLVAGALYNIGDKKRALELFQKLIENQDENGSVKNSKTTITKSGGKSLIVETTSIAIINWLNEKQYIINAEKAMKWLLGQCQYGSFGNTQGTILALKAIMKFEKVRSSNMKGNVKFTVNDQTFTKEITGETDTIPFDEITKLISKPGDYKISFEVSNDLSVPYMFSVDYFSIKPDTSKDAKIKLSTKLTETQVEEGSGAEIMVEVENIEDQPQGMTMVIIGLPGGLEPRHEQLKELVKSEKIGFYEIRGRDVAIYLRTMKAKEILKFKIDVIARIPGVYTGPASRSYLYYTDEDKFWIDGLTITIHPTGEKIKDIVQEKSKGLFGSISNTDFEVKL